MGLITRIVFAIIPVVLIGCMAKSVVMPADRVKGEKFYFDCCNPSLSAGTKEMCRMAAQDEDGDGILWDEDDNQYIFIWSDCEPGKERWREWED